MDWHLLKPKTTVIPAHAGIQAGKKPLDSRMRGNDGFLYISDQINKRGMLNHMKNREHVVTARETENDMLMRCAAAARSLTLAARDQRDANVFRVAAMVVQSRLPRAGKPIDASE